ncbi:hypothetical protein ACFCX4_00430 [Kitasatospora sp. NPDC056327]|uniref:hypothetical protein n=1 Tax=Kitasatospora sp. NPDC056327 TaxID=3345785 RepID=UPI0035DE2549
MSAAAGPRLPRRAARLAGGVGALLLVALAAVAVALTAPRLSGATGTVGVHGRFLREACPASEERPPASVERPPPAEHSPPVEGPPSTGHPPSLEESTPAGHPPPGCEGRFTPDGGDPTHCCTLHARTVGPDEEIEVRCADGRCHESGTRAAVWWLGLLLIGLAPLPAGALLGVLAAGRRPGRVLRRTTGTLVALLLLVGYVGVLAAGPDITSPGIAP